MDENLRLTYAGIVIGRYTHIATDPATGEAIATVPATVPDLELGWRRTEEGARHNGDVIVGRGPTTKAALISLDEIITRMYF